MDNQTGTIADELDSISERIGDLSITLLREAIERGQARPREDRVLAQARRAVDRAAELLRGLTTG